jgi:hypothetical protein
VTSSPSRSSFLPRLRRRLLARRSRTIMCRYRDRG